MQIVSGNNLHELSNPVFWKKKKREKYINMWSAEKIYPVISKG